MRDLLLSLRSVAHNQIFRVAICGAGEAGAQLAAALRLAGNHPSSLSLMILLCFVRSINGIPIQPPQV